MQRLWRWAAQGRIRSDALDDLGRELGLLPDRAGWQRFLDRALLGGGALSLGLGLIFLVAANWSTLGLWFRFGLAEAAVLGGAALYWHQGDSRAGRAGLGFSFLALGALLALFGQTYQTGVDPYHLFATWALLALPWVWLTRHAVLWLAWLLLVDIAVFRWLNYRVSIWSWLRDEEWLAWSFIAVHALGFVLVEFAWRLRVRIGRIDWLRIALWLVLLGASTWIALIAIVDPSDLAQPGLAIVYLLVAAGGGWCMRVARVSVLGLAALCASLTTLLLSGIAKLIDPWDSALTLLFMSAMVTACSVVSAMWLISVHRSTRGGR